MTDNLDIRDELARLESCIPPARPPKRLEEALEEVTV